MQEWLIHAAANYPYLVYGIVVLLACAEGPYLSMIAGVLLRLGYFSFWPVYAALMLGDLVGDVIWYWIGRHYGMRFVRRFGHYFSITEENFGKVERVFHRHKHSILFISKITNGFGFALVTLMTAGMARISFWRYMVVNVVGQFVWSGALIGVGYFLGHLYASVNDALGYVSVTAVAAVVVAAFIGYRRYLKKQAERIL